MEFYLRIIYYSNKDKIEVRAPTQRRGSHVQKRIEQTNQPLPTPYANENFYGERKFQNVFKAERANGVLQSK